MIIPPCELMTSDLRRQSIFIGSLIAFPQRTPLRSILASISFSSRDVSMKIARSHIETTEQLAHVEQTAGNQMAYAIAHLPTSVDSQQF